MDDELLRAFASALPSSSFDEQRCRLLLESLLVEAQEANVDIRVAPLEFACHVAAQIAGDPDPMASLENLHGSDLHVAFACGRGDPAAIQALEDRYLPKVDPALRRACGSPAAVEEAKQRLRESVLLKHGDQPPRILRYSGRGALASWLCVAAVRLALRLSQAERREGSLTGELIDGLSSPRADPELAYLKALYEREFRAAFEDAIAALTRRDRNLLRCNILEGLSIQQIAAVYHIHYSTAARQLAQARANLADQTRAALARRVKVETAEADSILRLIQSQLDLSIRRYLERPGAKKP